MRIFSRTFAACAAAVLLLSTPVYVAQASTRTADYKTDQVVTIPSNGITFLPDQGVKPQGGLLSPGNTYRFLMRYTFQGKTMDFSPAQMAGNQFVFTPLQGGQYLSYIGVEQVGQQFYLVVKTSAAAPSQQLAVTYELRLETQEKNTLVHKSQLSFTIGHSSVSDQAISAVSLGKPLYITNQAPLITQAQFNRLDSITQGNPVSITNGIWTIEALVGGLSSQNFATNNHVIEELARQYPNQQFYFLNFTHGLRFTSGVKLTLDLSQLSAFQDSFYLYTYRNGKLTKPHADYQPDVKQITFTFTDLESVILTSKPLPAAEESAWEVTSPVTNPPTGAL